MTITKTTCSNCSRTFLDCPKCGNGRYCADCGQCDLCGRVLDHDQREAAQKVIDRLKAGDVLVGPCYSYFIREVEGVEWLVASDLSELHKVEDLTPELIVDGFLFHYVSTEGDVDDFLDCMYYDECDSSVSAIYFESSNCPQDPADDIDNSICPACKKGFTNDSDWSVLCPDCRPVRLTRIGGYVSHDTPKKDQYGNNIRKTLEVYLDVDLKGHSADDCGTGSDICIKALEAAVAKKFKVDRHVYCSEFWQAR